MQYNFWQLAEPHKRIYDPIIGSLIHNLDDAASDIHVPISLLLIQILDIIFQSMPKSHYISSSFWMPGRNFTTVYVIYEWFLGNQDNSRDNDVHLL